MITLVAMASASLLAAMAPGQTVRLPAGEHELVQIRGKRFDPPVTIVADGAIVRGVQMWDSAGIIWRGGVIMAPTGMGENGPNAWGVDARRVQGVRFENVTVTNARLAMIFSDSRGIVVRDSTFTGLRSDGLNIVSTSDVLVEKNVFTNFKPTKATGSKADGTWKDGDHPDAIQMWVNKPTDAMSDVTIRNNVVDGDTQGISTFGPTGRGHSRIHILNNRLRVKYPAGAVLVDCTDCSIRGNVVETIPGAPYRAHIWLNKSPTAIVCGNDVKAFPDHMAEKKCR